MMPSSVTLSVTPIILEWRYFPNWTATQPRTDDLDLLMEQEALLFLRLDFILVGTGMWF